MIATPSSKRKLPLESGHSFGFSNKKRRSIIKSLGIDLLPDSLFNSTSTPGSGTNYYLMSYLLLWALKHLDVIIVSLNVFSM